MDNAIKTNIINDLGISALPAEQQEEVLAKIGEAIFAGVVAKVIEQLNDTDAKSFQAVLEETKNNPESNKVLEFLQDKIPNLDQIVADEVEEFKKSSDELMKAIK